MQQRYEFRLNGGRRAPSIIGTIVFAALAVGLILLLMTFGIVVAVGGLALSAVAGIAIAVRRWLGLATGDESCGEARLGADEEEVEFDLAQRGPRRLDRIEGEIIDVEVVEEVRDEEPSGER